LPSDNNTIPHLHGNFNQKIKKARYYSQTLYNTKKSKNFAVAVFSVRFQKNKKGSYSEFPDSKPFAIGCGNWI
jgi:hypothetical protein